MTDLIARLEAAGEGSRELDARICAIQENRTITHDDEGRILGRHNDPPHDCCILFWQGGPDYKYVLHYTTSLDAALTLMPEGWFWEVGCNGDPGTLYISLIRGPEDQKRPEGQYAVGLSNTPALALCIAALKAREKANG